MVVNNQMDHPVFKFKSNKSNLAKLCPSSSRQKSCIHMRPNSGALSARFEVRVGQCGLSSSGNIENNGQPNPAGSYLENTIIVQYDPQVQEVWDQGWHSMKCCT